MFDELCEMVDRIGAVATEASMSAQEFCEFLKKLSTEPVVLSDKNIFLDDDKIWIIPTNTEKPIKLVIERDKKERWEWLDNDIDE